MKQLSTIALLLLSINLYGKKTGITLPTMYPHFGSSAPAQATPGTAPVRLISSTKAIYDGSSFVAYDSSNYKYSSNRGGLLDLDYTDNFLDFDESVYFKYAPSENLYKSTFRYTQSFSANNSVLYRVQENWLNNQLQWQNNTRHEYLYDPSFDQLLRTNIQIWNGTWAGNSVNYLISYSPKGDIIEVDFTTSKTFLVYDQNHNITERLEYKYMQGTGWDYTDKYSFQYNTSQQLTEYVYQRLINGIWENFQKEEYSYTNGNPSIAKHYNWESSNWEVDHQKNFTYDGNDNKLTAEVQKWDDVTSSFINTKKEFWAYSAEQQPIAYYSQSWDEAAQNWTPKQGDFYNRYKYEYYNPTSLPKEPNSPELVTVYPIPATDVLNLQLKTKPAGSTSGSIYDMQGKTVKTFQLNSSTETIPVNELPSGTYTLNISFNGKKIAQPIVIAR